ncbi:MAG TPA: glycosyltransferase [Pilimelia sp.]|nr:glycosyltransferase [Pilimelia sp.]
MSAADRTGPRVLHVSHAADAGGAELALVRLLAGDRAWIARVCAPRTGGAFDVLEQHGTAVRRCLPALPGGGTRGRNPVLAARYLARLCAGGYALRRSGLMREADIIHANTAAAAIICALVHRDRSAPLVVHLRDLVMTESLGRFGHAAFTRVALRRADAVIANSRSTLDSARSWLGAGVPAAVIPSPVGLSRRFTEPRVRPQVRAIGMIGRLQPWKGQHVFLRAFARGFRDTGVRAYVAGAPLSGEVAYADELRRLAADLGISGQVSFLGHVDDTESFFDSVDVVVHASTRPEPLGQTVIQGLAYGKPVIASAGGGPSEWITSGVNGLLVEPDDASALAAAMTALAGSYDRRARLAAAGARTEGILTDQECTAAHAGFFRAVWQDHRSIVGRAG